MYKRQIQVIIVGLTPRGFDQQGFCAAWETLSVVDNLLHDYITDTRQHLWLCQQVLAKVSYLQLGTCIDREDHYRARTDPHSSASGLAEYAEIVGAHYNQTQVIFGTAIRQLGLTISSI